MVFRFYSNTISQASRDVAAWIFIVGMFLIGFGLLIFLFPEFFATLAAIVFWIMGIGCAVTAVKIFLATRFHGGPGPSQGYRENVHIHIEEHHNQ
jgi:hypothetical protein